MKLKMQLDNLEGVVESLKPFYTEKDGKFHLNLDGYEPPEALLRAKNHEKQLRQEAETKVRELTTQVTDLETKVTELEDTNRQKGGMAALEQSWKDKLAKANSDHATELSKRDAQINKLLVDNVADSMAAELSDAPELLGDIIRKRLTVKDGQTRVLDANGELSATTLEELREEFKGNKKYAAIIRGSQANGGGSNGGGSGGSPTKAFKDMSEKERTELARVNPGEYQRQLDAHRAANKTNY